MYFYCINNNLYNIKFNEKFVEKNKKKKNNQFNNTNTSKYYKAIIFRIS